MDKIKFLNSETAIKYIEEELVRIEGQIDQLKYQKTTLKVKQPVEIEDLILYTKFFFEHLDILLLKQSNPIARANFFSLIFNTTPDFSALKIRTPENKKTTEVSDVFLALLEPDNHVAGDEGFEPPILGPEPSALPLGQSPLAHLIITYLGFEIRPTSGGPVTTSLQTSLQEWIPLRPATGGSHPDPGTRIQCLTAWPIPNNVKNYTLWNHKSLGSTGRKKINQHRLAYSILSKLHG